MNTREIAGEDVEALRGAIRHFQLGPADEHGMRDLQVHAPTEELAPLLRALMRVEAQLLLRDADDFPHTEQSCRTEAQRRHDALVEIVEQWVRAVTPGPA